MDRSWAGVSTSPRARCVRRSRRARTWTAVPAAMATNAAKSPLTQVVGGRPRSDVEKPRSGSKLRRFFVTLGRDAMADRIDDVGAMMAYYAILALFPMLVFVSTIASLVLDYSTIEEG